KLFELHLVGTSRRPVDRQRPSGSRGNNDADQGFSPLAVRPARAGRLRSRSDLLRHDRREGRARAHARRRQDRESMLWTGPAEAGDTRFSAARGSVQVIGTPGGIGKSEAGGSRAFDSYDLIEWIAAQPGCDGNVGMVGFSGFGAEQLMAAKLNPPH